MTRLPGLYQAKKSDKTVASASSNEGMDQAVPRNNIYALRRDNCETQPNRNRNNIF